MAGTYIGKYDTTAANNTATSTGSVSVAEGMLPSNINNAFRDLMADIRQFYNSVEWIEYGDGAGTYTPAYASSTSFTIAGVDVTSAYHVGRRVKVVAATPGTIYGSITATSFSTIQQLQLIGILDHYLMKQSLQYTLELLVHLILHYLKLQQ